MKPSKTTDGRKMQSIRQLLLLLDRLIWPWLHHDLGTSLSTPNELFITTQRTSRHQGFHYDPILKKYVED